MARDNRRTGRNDQAPRSIPRIAPERAKAALDEIARAPLPLPYDRAKAALEAAKAALEACEADDACATWENKAEARASYTRQAADQSLHDLADHIQRLIDHIQARARRRLKDFPPVRQRVPRPKFGAPRWERVPRGEITTPRVSELTRQWCRYFTELVNHREQRLFLPEPLVTLLEGRTPRQIRHSLWGAAHRNRKLLRGLELTMGVAQDGRVWVAAVRPGERRRWKQAQRKAAIEAWQARRRD